MAKILIADDEKYVRDKIREIVDTMDCFESFVSEDGEETLEIIKNNNIDALLLDINMPVITGMEVLEEIRRMNLDIFVAIITGINDFEYAREAIKLDAVEYISKPVTPQKIRELLGNLYDRIQKKEKLKNEYASLVEQVELSRESIKARFFNELLTGRLTDSAIAERAEFLNMNISGKAFTVGLLEIDINNAYMDPMHQSDKERKLQILLKAAENKISEILLKYSGNLLFQIDSGIYVIIANMENPVPDFTDILEKIKKSLYLDLGISAAASVGEKVESFSRVNSSFEQAKKAMRYRMFLGDEYILSIHDMEGRAVDKPIAFDMEAVKLAIKMHQYKEIENNIHHTFEIVRLNKESYTLLHVSLLASKYIISLIEVLQDYNLCTDEIYNLIGEITNHKTIDEFEKWLCKLFIEYAKMIEEKQSATLNSVVDRIKTIIKTQYMENISLLSISKALNYSPNYLGHHFIVNTGYTVSEYINNERIRKAKELLKNSNFKTYEIAFEIGYNDNNYFCTVFKKVTGLTPKEYRNL